MLGMRGQTVSKSRTVYFKTETSRERADVKEETSWQNEAMKRASWAILSDEGQSRLQQADDETPRRRETECLGDLWETAVHQRTGRRSLDG